MNNYNKIINILESYRYSKTYYDIEKDIAKLGLMEIKELASRFYNKNENLLIESSLDDYYISDNININESAGYVATSIMNTILKGLKVVINIIMTYVIPMAPAAAGGAGIGLAADKIASKTTNALLSGGIGAAAIVGAGITGVVLSNAVWSLIFKRETELRKLINKKLPDEKVAEIKSIVDKYRKKYPFEIVSKDTSLLNKITNQNFDEIEKYLYIIISGTNNFYVKPIANNKYCSISYDDLVDYLGRFSNAKNEHDFKQLLNTIKHSCDKAKEKGVHFTITKKTIESASKKISSLSKKIDDELKKNKAVNNNDNKENISGTLKLAHEVITALKSVTAQTMKLYKNVSLYLRDVTEELEKCLKGNKK